MALKLAFRFNRTSYSPSTIRENNPIIKNRLQTLLDAKCITYSHMYDPARNSIKVIFPSENEIEKVMKNNEHFKNEHFTPKPSLALKANRTVFCTNLDPALLSTYTDKNEIKNMLQEQNWKIENIYFMKSKRSFKIEMKNRKQAKEFIKNPHTHIGGIKLTDDNKEPEIDPTINQCWECGQLEPNHKPKFCPGPKICLKCGCTDHKFFECPIPKDIKDMSESEKAARYCATCRKKTDHTTLDHKYCPIKREQLREKARTAREKRMEEKDKITRETELITRALDMSNKQEWPSLSMNINSQQTKMTTIITCALIDEACKPGIFNKKLKEACKNNNLPVVTYNLEPDTAQNFLAAMTSSQNKSNIQIKDIPLSTTASPLNTSTPKRFTKYYKDMTKAANKKTTQQEKQEAAQSEQVEQAPEQANQTFTNIFEELQL